MADFCIQRQWTQAEYNEALIVAVTSHPVFGVVAQAGATRNTSGCEPGVMRLGFPSLARGKPQAELSRSRTAITSERGRSATHSHARSPCGYKTLVNRCFARLNSSAILSPKLCRKSNQTALRQSLRHEAAPAQRGRGKVVRFGAGIDSSCRAIALLAASAQKVVRALLARRLVTSGSPKGPLRLGFSADAAGHYFPNLHPAGTD